MLRRVDAAETALARTGVDVDIEGYAVIHELAVSNLELGIDVVVDAVNAVPEAGLGGARPLIEAGLSWCRSRPGYRISSSIAAEPNKGAPTSGSAGPIVG